LTGNTQCIVFECTEGQSEGCEKAHWDLGLVFVPPVVDGDDSENPDSPDPKDPLLGVFGSGFWKNHLSAWPVEEITVGGITYSAEEVAALLTNGSDKTKTLFRSLVTAKLNVALGNDGSCIEEILNQADQWLVENPLGSGIKGGNLVWKEEGRAIQQTLEQYSEGNLCAVAVDESRIPSEVSVGFGSDNAGGPKEFRIRMKGQAGRKYVLQESMDMEIWTDVMEFTNHYGVAESVLSDFETMPNAFYRIIVAPGPANIEKPGKEGLPTFKNVGAGQLVTLEPIVYEGNLVVTGAMNEINGVVLDEKRFTVIAGNLEIRGNSNIVRDISVLGEVIIRGKNNVFESVDFENDQVEESETEI